MPPTDPDPSADSDSPKTTRAPAASRRPGPFAGPKTTSFGRRTDAVPDRIDAQDWFYQPSLAPLPLTLANCDPAAVLDQGFEGACTGFALAAVINHLSAVRGAPARVSPRMLYEMARRYDEWPGANYEGSSARGAMKGWVRHGVCGDKLWPPTLHGEAWLDAKRSDEARCMPGGAFYRVKHREVRDMHAAIAAVGAIYATLMVHDGWASPGGSVETVRCTLPGQERELRLPVIARDGSADSGHAVALVGYTAKGFVVQNSWGTGWGAEGFALLPYEDFLIHATDVWVAQLGVPVAFDLWQAGKADTTAGLYRANAAIPLADIRPFIVDIGNNGRLSDSGRYWTTPEDVERLFTETIPCKTKDWSRRRVLFFLHGGLNDEDAVARRVVAFRDVMIKNEIYPIHIMWESGAAETVHQLIEDMWRGLARAGDAASWWRSVREGLTEARDWTLEMSFSVPGTALWTKMKENARLASEALDGGMQVVAAAAARALAGLAPAQRGEWELHVVGHSAGSIFAAHALPLFIKAGVPFKTLQLLAPAMTMDLFARTILPAVQNGAAPVPDLYVLSATGETDDDVGPYGKSLLHLVSNAFEGRRETPLLGMEHFLDNAPPAIKALLEGHVTVAGAAPPEQGTYPQSRSETHGGFDNDPNTMNSVLWRILGRRDPEPPFDVRDLQY